jgi:hypothetical protein
MKRTDAIDACMRSSSRDSIIIDSRKNFRAHDDVRCDRVIAQRIARRKIFVLSR